MVVFDIFALRQSAYQHACRSPRAGLWVGGFIAVSGVLYGALLALFQRVIGGEIQGIPVAEIPDWILFGGNIASGVLIAVAGHAGITLVAWLMARAIGGPGLLIGLYRSSAYLLPYLWLTLPLLTASVTAGEPTVALPLQWSYLPLAVAGAALFFAGLFQVFVVTQDKGPLRCAAGVVLFALFSASVLLVF